MGTHFQTASLYRIFARVGGGGGAGREGVISFWDKKRVAVNFNIRIDTSGWGVNFGALFH